MEVRLAKKEDCADVCRLWKLLLRFYRKEIAPGTLEDSFNYVMNHPEKVLVFIVLKEGVVTGTASLHLGHYSTWYGNFYGHVEDVIVDPAHRGSGAAAKLLEHVIAKARELGLARLELAALEGNCPACSLYEKMGFTTDSVAYELRL